MNFDKRKSRVGQLVKVVKQIIIMKKAIVKGEKNPLV
jgi:hypothetical protein